jgi:hypothetical protein
MTSEQSNELKFIAARNQLDVKLWLMLDFVKGTTPEEIGATKYQNLKEIATLGIMLIQENAWQHSEIAQLRTQLAKEMRMNTELLRR